MAHDTPPDLARELATGEYELRQVRLYQGRLLSVVEAQTAGALRELEGFSPRCELPGTAADAASMEETGVSNALDKLLKSQRYEREAQVKLRRALLQKVEFY
jgi:hypothetical protein